MPEWRYYENVPVVFSSNLDSSHLQWNSSIDGELGTGSCITRYLSKGNHVITLKHEITGVFKIVNVNVLEKTCDYNNVLLLQENYKKYSCDNSSDFIGIFSLNGTLTDCVINENFNDNYLYSNNNICKRDFILQKENLSQIAEINRSRNILVYPEFRTFNVINTITQTECHSVDMKLLKITENFVVYVDSNVSEKQKELVEECVNSFENNCYYKVKTIWGNCYDVNSDGKFTLCFTPLINSERVAVGFFNQKDFFKNNKNQNDANYNPFSNEMDVCYIGVPEEYNSSYSINSIIATLAHEITHAINFSNKTYKKIQENLSDYLVFDIYLDEGLSHLTESLCGYGLSGGNMDFVNHYLSNTESYSFCSTDIYGSYDSIYQRGAMTLFLYYLFTMAGSFYYTENNQIIDSGGITFLKNIINSNYYDWNSIGDALGTSSDELFKDFAIRLLTESVSDIYNFSIKDPITSEQLFCCNEITVQNKNYYKKILPYSIVKIQMNTDDFNIGWNENKGNCYLVVP